MIKKVLLIGIPLFIVGVIASTSVFSFTDGAPASCSGSPNDGANCSTSCHSTAKNEEKPGWITSNIPETGYKPDSVYMITATSTGIESSTKFGFEVSPQFATGKVAGKLVLTNPTEMKLLAGGKFITQKMAGVDGKGSRTWNFKWTAPPKGSGKVTIYGAFLIGGKPEISVTSNLEVNESI
jgi:hypothetical protein